MNEGLPIIHTSAEDITNIYCLFCGWPAILAEDPDRQDFCEHVLFFALDDGGVTHVGDEASRRLSKAGFMVEIGANDCLVTPPRQDGDSTHGPEDDDYDDGHSVSELVAVMAQALSAPEGLVLVSDSQFLGDPAMYIGFARWSQAA
jgi:hypothetical protein